HWQVHLPERAQRPKAGELFSRFSLFDPPRQDSMGLNPAAPGVKHLQSLPIRCSGTDLFNAGRLKARMNAVEEALKDLPAQARRFARWWALREHELAQRKAEAASRPVQPLPSREERARIRKELASSPPPPPPRRRRFHALRIGKPPGCRLKRIDPSGRLPSGS